MKDKIGWIRLAIIPLFILAISYSQYRLFRWTINDPKHILAIFIFSLFCILTILELFYYKTRGLTFFVCNKLIVLLGFLSLFLKLGFFKWITYIVIVREILVIVGWFVFYNLFPSDVFGKERGILGKGTFFFQMLVILLYLVYGMTPFTYFFTIVMLTFAITSLLDYLINA